MPTKLTQLEQEPIYLLAALESIDSMANYALLDVTGSDPDSEIRFKEPAHQTLFNVLLVDFLSRTDPTAPVPSRTYLDALAEVAEHPMLASPEEASELKDSVADFRGWLGTEIMVEIWLATIRKQLDLRLTRQQFLRMAGNTSKHNMLRLARVATQFKKLVANSGATVDDDEAMLALSDFHARFHDDILNYHSSTICEFLNNIRWGIYEYLRQAARDRYLPNANGSIGYKWTSPSGLNSRYAHECHWNLMNAVRSPPYMPRFHVTRWLKIRY